MGNILNKKDFAEIKERILDVKRDDLPIWGKMNAGEMLCHAADQVKLATGEITVPDQSKFMTRVVLKRLILMGMPAPKGKVETLPEINPQIHGSKPVNFEPDRDYLLRKLEDFLSAPEDSVKPHPVFGELSKKQWGKLIYVHLNHHLNQFGS